VQIEVKNDEISKAEIAGGDPGSYVRNQSFLGA
jgi:hypothetical protein